MRVWGPRRGFLLDFPTPQGLQAEVGEGHDGGT